MTATKTTFSLKIMIQSIDRSYAVYEVQEDGSMKKISKDYFHSTSAFAALGRLYQKEAANAPGRITVNRS